ncbi:MAG TPA: oligoendopeptidase F [Cerasibacillus sp.]|uniref:oligoendopeptidase F n=1 Tax=Cerasibacillus sp. TaxID=2498711 RepID=UPI002F3ED006
MTTQVLQKRSEIPNNQKWDLSALFSSHDDWEKERQALEEDVQKVSAYKGKLNESAEQLFGCITAYEAYLERLIRVSTYASLRLSTDGSDSGCQRDAAKVAALTAKINAQLTFIETELLDIPKERFEQFKQDEPQLNNYQKMLNDILKKKPYTLTPEVEETLAALEEVHQAPYMIYSRSKSSDMVFDPIQDGTGKEIPMSAALYEEKYEISEDTTVRRNAYDSYIKTLNQYKHTYAATYATEVTKQVTLAKLRGYDSVTEMLLQPQEVTLEMYENQLDIIQSELAPHMRRYAKLKKEKLGLEDIRYCDLKAPLDPDYNPKTTYDEAKETILEALKVMGPEYHNIMKEGFTNGWVDRSNNIGKATGAFCSSPYGAHPYILLTWTDTMESAFTLAHELGHAGHFYLAQKNHSLFNTRPSTYFVEAPSTMNELLLGNYLLEKAGDNKQLKRWVITQLLGTYYHNFITHLLEGEYQRRVYDLAEKGTPLTADVLSTQKKEAIQAFWGDEVVIDDGAGLIWMRQPHYYMGLYPYTYSAGLTVSTAVAHKIKEKGEPAVNGWLDVLKAGGTLSPLELIKKVGIDMTKPDAIKTAVQYVGSLVDELEKSYE